MTSPGPSPRLHEHVHRRDSGAATAGLGKGLGALIPDAQRTNQGAVGSVGSAGSVGPVDTSHPQGTVGVIPAGHSADAAGRRPSGDGDAGLRPVDGAYFEEVAIDSIAPNPRQPRVTFDEEALEELPPPSPRWACCSRSWCGSSGRIATSSSWASAGCGHRGRPGVHPGDRPRDVGQRQAPRRADGEPAPCAAKPAGRGRRLRAVAQGLRRHARAARRADRALASTGLQRPPAARPAAGGGEAQSRPGCSPPGTPGRCSAWTRQRARRLAQRIVSEGHSVRTVEEIVTLGGRQTRPGDPRPARAKRRPALSDLSSGCRICSRLG